ncbi:MAG: hypothetical protein P8J69_00420 [Flavobacteriaceae bacterium]|nr:hypothetical protein [Flavobacteriaceae bacterium]
MKTMNKVNTVEKVDLSNYTLKQKQSLQKGYEIWCSGCLSGDWEDEVFRNNNIDNSDWIFFESVFGDWLTNYGHHCRKEEEILWGRHNVLTNTFGENTHTKKYKTVGNYIDNLLNRYIKKYNIKTIFS